ncbi:expressed unknown protein [Seminavis robusta]|uniref:Uncharacterized protein n=1 Tax=Seminavis robusta TaxID=568900 RepID=A0A9N8EFC4_9STRA|nr:expressed unknown protein [Seminavis robusta]|eukprot:Sro862_g212420.1 n/a (337) ;mRNA; r:12399-13409
MVQVQIRYNQNNSLRRTSSKVAERKSIYEDDSEVKRVTWSPVEETSQDLSNPYDGVPREDIWYSPAELREIRMDNETIASICSSSNKNPCPLDETVRGLETMTDQGAWERFVNHRDCVNKVLDEQDRQKGIDGTEFQHSPYPLVRRANYLHIPFDHERVAALCRDVTAKARRAATQRGKRDAVAATKAQQDKEIPAPKMIQTSRKPVVIPKDDDTVQTESSTQPGSTATGNDPAASSPRPIPRVVSLSLQASSPPPAVPETPITLERKTKERYAAYLINREQRIRAREEAASDWEQRRVARQASIRFEADSSIARLKRIMALSDEFVELIAARNLI